MIPAMNYVLKNGSFYYTCLIHCPYKYIRYPGLSLSLNDKLSAIGKLWSDFTKHPPYHPEIMGMKLNQIAAQILEEVKYIDLW